jgi:zinc protease
VEVTLVGDVDEQTAVAAVAKTLGALPERAPGDRTRPDAAHVRFDARPPAPITIRHRGAQDQAFVQFTWPLYVWSPALIHESRALNLMARTLQDAVLDRVRQSLAKSYSPTVAVSLPRGGDQASLSVKVLTTPAAAAQVRDEISKIAAGFASNGVSPEQFARARTPWLDALAKARTYNSWWMSTLDGSSRYPDKLLSAREGLADLQRVTLAEVNHEATLWLALQPYVITVLPEAATPAPGQGPAEDRPNPHFSDDGPSGADQP